MNIERMKREERGEGVGKRRMLEGKDTKVSQYPICFLCPKKVSNFFKHAETDL